MHEQATTSTDAPEHAVVEIAQAERRQTRRERTLRSALTKRAAGVPTYSVPEAAALLSVSQEHLYRLIHADAFPAVPMRVGLERGRYVVPAAALEALLKPAKNGDEEPQVNGYAIGGAR